ncbi:MAG: sigma-54-dependent transcriptional regulator [Terriglobales bacterium]
MATAVAPNAFVPPNPQPVSQAKNPALLNLLILDHDRFVREACREAAAVLGFRARVAEFAEQATWLIDAHPVDVILLDLNLPGRNGLEVLRQIKLQRPDVEVVVTTANSDVQAAVEAMKAGAFDHIVKPFGLRELQTLLQRVADHLKIKSEKRLLLERCRSSRGFCNLIGHAPEMDRLYRMIAKAAQSVHPLLIQGESGTGKEMVARAIHYSGPLREGPFVPVDCGSLVPTLIESELFGHMKGAFTGATHTKEGLLVLAEGGTVFLDEVGELPLDLQSRLLRALQDREIRPVGSTRTVPIKARILAATNRDLEQAVGQGLFRRDLYFRLNVLSLRIPPLRERRNDIPLLVTSFLERLSRAARRSIEVSDDAMNALIAYDWPGNVRELENCIERCCAMNSGPVIHTNDLPDSVTGSALKLARGRPEARIVRIADMERGAILGAVEQLNGDKLTAAKLLGIGKTTLYRKLKEYGDCQ